MKLMSGVIVMRSTLLLSGVLEQKVRQFRNFFRHGRIATQK